MNNGQVKRKKPPVQRVILILTDTAEGKFSADITFEPSRHDKKTGKLTELAKNSPSCAVGKRLCEIICDNFQEKSKIILTDFRGA